MLNLWTGYGSQTPQTSFPKDPRTPPDPSIFDHIQKKSKTLPDLGVNLDTSFGFKHGLANKQTSRKETVESQSFKGQASKKETSTTLGLPGNQIPRNPVNIQHKQIPFGTQKVLIRPKFSSRKQLGTIQGDISGTNDEPIEASTKPLSEKDNQSSSSQKLIPTFKRYRKQAIFTDKGKENKEEDLFKRDTESEIGSAQPAIQNKLSTEDLKVDHTVTTKLNYVCENEGEMLPKLKSAEMSATDKNDNYKRLGLSDEIHGNSNKGPSFFSNEENLVDEAIELGNDAAEWTKEQSEELIPQVECNYHERSIEVPNQWQYQENRQPCIQSKGMNDQGNSSFFQGNINNVQRTAATSNLDNMKPSYSTPSQPHPSHSSKMIHRKIPTSDFSKISQRTPDCFTMDHSESQVGGETYPMEDPSRSLKVKAPLRYPTNLIHDLRGNEIKDEGPWCANFPNKAETHEHLGRSHTKHFRNWSNMVLLKFTIYLDVS